MKRHSPKLGRLSLTQPVAHSTVQTLLRQMEEKGMVEHKVEDRVFLFSPIHQRTEVTGTLAHDLLKQVFQGSVYGLVSSLLTEEPVSSDEFRPHSQADRRVYRGSAIRRK